jgi:DNA repair protein RadD
MELRDYQREAVEASFDFLRRGGRAGLVVAPTGAGKSAILAAQVEQIVGHWGARCLIATHRAELIRQDEAAIVRYWPDGRDRVGVYSAGLGRREMRSCTVAGVQSVARRAGELGHVDVVLIDEAHLVSPKSDTQYGRLLSTLREVNPDLAVLGLTATPYRLGQGLLTQGEGRIFDSVCYDIGVRRLIDGGYLTPLVPARASAKIDTTDVRISGGEYLLADLELAADVDSITEAVARDIAETRRRHVLVFGVSVAHAARLRNAIRMHGISCETVTGETPNRGEILERFKAGEIQCLTSCDVLTTGFDAPLVDCIAIVRPTQSPALYVQICGRGSRIAPGKKDCVVLDYGGNIARHGPIDAIKIEAKQSRGGGKAPVKLCPTCYAECPANARTCEHCGHVFPAPVRRANESASTLAVISDGKAKPEPERRSVERVEYARHEKDGKTPSMRVSYYGSGSRSAYHPVASEWICVEHEGFARLKAEAWWKQHFPGVPCPDTVDVALEVARSARRVEAIWTIPDGKYVRVTGYEFGRMRQPGEDDDEEIDEETTTSETQENADSVSPWDDDDDLPF